MSATPCFRICLEGRRRFLLNAIVPETDCDLIPNPGNRWGMSSRMYGGTDPVLVRDVGSAYDRPVPGNLEVFTRVWYYAPKNRTQPSCPRLRLTSSNGIAGFPCWIVASASRESSWSSS